MASEAEKVEAEEKTEASPPEAEETTEEIKDATEEDEQVEETVEKAADDEEVQEEDSERGNRLYVGNLSYHTSWQDLKDHMRSSGGEVVHADIMMGHNGRSKGCGIVEFETAEAAQQAMLTLNDSELDGRQIFLREDREGRGSGGPQHGNSRFSTGEQSQSKRVYIGNLSWDVAWQDLKDHMRQAGEVSHAEVIMEMNGRSKGCGIVEYATENEAQEAIRTLTDTELKGRMIFVREDRETGSGAFHGGHGGGRSHGTSVYVWNLSYETSWQTLKDHMRSAGNVDQANLLTGPDGRSIGCATVVYQRPQEAARAIRELQGSELDGRPISIREDRTPAQGEYGGGRGRGRGGRYGSGGRGGRGGRAGRVYSSYKGAGAGSSGMSVYVGNVSWETTQAELKEHFSGIGEIDNVELMEYPDGKKKGFGTVRFHKADDADKAIQAMDGVELNGRSLQVRMDNRA